MSIMIVQFLAIMLTVLALVPGGAHLIELPNKMRLPEADYMSAQHLYRGWALAGFVLVAALASLIWLAILSRSQRVPLVLSSAAFVLLLVTLVTFFVWVFPVNKATKNWTLATGDFAQLRARWEFTHAANAVLTVLAVAATVAASLTWRGD